MAAEEIAFIDSMALATEGDRSYCNKKALSRFDMSHREMIEEVDKTIAEADAGRFATDGQLQATFEKLGG